MALIHEHTADLRTRIESSEIDPNTCQNSVVKLDPQITGKSLGFTLMLYIISLYFKNNF